MKETILIYFLCFILGALHLKSQDCKQYFYNYLDYVNEKKFIEKDAFYLQEVSFINFYNDNLYKPSDTISSKYYTSENVSVAISDNVISCADNNTRIVINKITKQLLLTDNDSLEAKRNEMYNTYKSLIEKSTITSCEEENDQGMSVVVLKTNEQYKMASQIDLVYLYYDFKTGMLKETKILYENHKVLSGQIITYSDFSISKDIKIKSANEFVFDKKGKIKEEYLSYKILK